ncbi:MAG: hypothetical protein KGZ74_07845, partial [Chitinophagaceae bacterium]|nr:hypothetical protein [Chitinophagaceae bacterium]
MFALAGVFTGHHRFTGEKKHGTMIRLLLTILSIFLCVVVMAQRPGFPGGGNRNLLQSMPGGGVFSGRGGG